jgi:hypothetical protein
MATNPPEESEPSPTSAPPEGVDIPSETPFGDNVPMEPIEAVTEASEEASPEEEQPKEVAPASPGKAIEIGWLAVLMMAMLYGAGAYYVGTISPMRPSEGPPEEKEATPGEGSETGAKGTEGRGPRSAFTRDLGLFKRENSKDAGEIAEARISAASKHLVWVTSEPDNPKILGSLLQKRKKSSIPIYIIVGKETPRERTKKAVSNGIEVRVSSKELEIPYSVLVTDDRMVSDISREHWVWESKEPDIIKKTFAWAMELVDGGTVVK